MTKSENKKIEALKTEADIVMAFEDFKKVYDTWIDTSIGKVRNMRFVVGEGQIKALGYYTFLDPKTNKKTFVQA